MGKGIPDGSVIRHSCDKPACINPNHIRVGTQFDNIQDRNKRDRTAKGEKNGRAKLTKSKVETIRLLSSVGYTLSELSRRYGVTKSTIAAIKHYKIWKHV